MNDKSYKIWDKKEKVMYHPMTLHQLLSKNFELKSTDGHYSLLTKELRYCLVDYIFLEPTGIKDIHDKEIYEGDIVKDKTIYGGVIGDVVYHDIRAAFVLHDTELINSELYQYSHPEIIGNIYENKELLTNGATR